LLSKLLVELGVEKERFRLEWIAASDSVPYARIMNEMCDTIRKLGPYGKPRGAAMTTPEPVIAEVQSETGDICSCAEAEA
jgi:hypothetical protein